MSNHSTKRDQNQAAIVATLVGADRERRRIRRAQAKAIGALRTHKDGSVWTRVLQLTDAIERATRAPRAKRRRGT